ncbi:hypothetical protein [Mycolicibacterium vaccae]|nr:hypothetical protein [Mycolicibacterium vaccae]
MTRMLWLSFEDVTSLTVGTVLVWNVIVAGVPADETALRRV